LHDALAISALITGMTTSRRVGTARRPLGPYAALLGRPEQANRAGRIGRPAKSTQSSWSVEFCAPISCFIWGGHNRPARQRDARRPADFDSAVLRRVMMMTSCRLRILAQVLPFLLITPGLALAQAPPNRSQAAAALNQPNNPAAA